MLPRSPRRSPHDDRPAPIHRQPVPPRPTGTQDTGGRHRRPTGSGFEAAALATSGAFALVPLVAAVLPAHAPTAEGQPIREGAAPVITGSPILAAHAVPLAAASPGAQQLHTFSAADVRLAAKNDDSDSSDSDSSDSDGSDSGDSDGSDSGDSKDSGSGDSKGSSDSDSKKSNSKKSDSGDTGDGSGATADPAASTTDPAAAPATTAQTYAVQAGDTLSSIAGTHGTTWQELWNTNRSTVPQPNALSPGQQLTLPGAATGTGAATGAGDATGNTADPSSSSSSDSSSSDSSKSDSSKSDSSKSDSSKSDSSKSSSDSSSDSKTSDSSSGTAEAGPASASLPRIQVPRPRDPAPGESTNGDDLDGPPSTGKHALKADSASVRTGPAKQLKIDLTGYSYQDNTPAGSSIVSHPILHKEAGGTGTFADPITVASPGSGGSMELTPGTKFYLPSVKRYVIVEDSGASPASGGVATHLDMWIDGREGTKSATDACMDKITGEVSAQENPPAGLPVQAGPIFGQTCSVGT